MDTEHDLDEVLWEEVQAALDHGRDPLLDPALAERLAARPRLRAEVLRLVRQLAVLAEGPGAEASVGPAARVPWSALAGVGSALGAAAAALLLARARPLAGPDPAPGAHALPSQVLEAHLELEHLRTTPPVPVVVERAPRHVLAWTLPGDSR